MRRASSKITVLMTVAPPDGSTKFVDQIVRFAPSDISFRYFSWGAAILGQYDVVHLHWPEALVRGRYKAVRVARSVLMMVWLLRLRFSRIAVVRTLHNIEPHTAGGRFESQLLEALNRRNDLVVKLNPDTPSSGPAATTLILHGHYAEVFSVFPRAPRNPRRVVYFGRVEKYKGVDILLEAFRGIQDTSLSLRVVGKAAPSYAKSIEMTAGKDSRVSTDLRFITDAELVTEVTSSELVVLPYRDMHNSGALLVALSLGVPTLAPLTAANALLQNEVGDSWLRLYEGPLTSRELAETLQWSTQAREGRPVFHPQRAWSSVADAYGDAYRRAVTIGAEK